MKKYVMLALFSLSLFTSIQAEECNKNYFKVWGGANFIGVKNTRNVKYHTGEVISLSIGRNLLPFLRAEFEASYRNNPMTYHVHTKEAFYSSSTVTMVNALADLPFCKFDIQPFIGGGLGGLISHEELYFTWQAIGGLSYSVSSRTRLFLEYRALKAKHHPYNHSVGVGFNYSFKTPWF